MNEKPEAMRLAEFYEALAEEPPRSPDNSNIRAAAAGLRRLAKVEAQRDALLEALRLVQVDCQHLHHSKKDQHALSQPCPVVDRINAAIKAVEEGK